MKPYLLSLGAGILVGVVYSLLGVRSPAPPVIALIGLLGILLGEQAAPLVKRVVQGRPINAVIKTKCVPEVLGSQAAPCAKTQENINPAVR